MRIRGYLPSDYARANALHLEAMAHANIPGEDLKGMEAYLENGAFLVALEGNEIVGMGGFMPEENAVRIDTMRVHPRMQGRGIGSLLLQKLLSEASARGAGTAVCDTARAKEFYLRHGFRVTGSHEYRGVVCTDLVKYL